MVVLVCYAVLSPESMYSTGMRPGYVQSAATQVEEVRLLLQEREPLSIANPSRALGLGLPGNSDVAVTVDTTPDSCLPPISMPAPCRRLVVGR